VAQQELYLVQFTSCIAAQARGSDGGHAGPDFEWLPFSHNPSRHATPHAPLHHFPKSYPRSKRTETRDLRSHQPRLAMNRGQS
jgi:hypothetical protein